MSSTHTVDPHATTLIEGNTSDTGEIPVVPTPSGGGAEGSQSPPEGSETGHRDSEPDKSEEGVSDNDSEVKDHNSASSQGEADLSSAKSPRKTPEPSRTLSPTHVPVHPSEDGTYVTLGDATVSSYVERVQSLGFDPTSFCEDQFLSDGSVKSSLLPFQPHHNPGSKLMGSHRNQ